MEKIFIYHYQAKTKEYLRRTQAEADPEETKRQNKFVPLIPAHATLTEPPVFGENEIPVFNGTSWEIKADYRKLFKINKETMLIEPIKNIGEIEEQYIIIDPATAQLAQENISLFKIENGKLRRKSKAQLSKEAKEQERLNQIADIKKQLRELDEKTIRPLRAGEKDRLKELEQECQILRAQLQDLER